MSSLRLLIPGYVSTALSEWLENKYIEQTDNRKERKNNTFKKVTSINSSGL